MNQYLLTYHWYEKSVNEYMDSYRIVRANSLDHAKAKLIYDLGDDIEIIAISWKTNNEHTKKI